MRSPDELTLIASITDDLPAGVWVVAAPSGAFVYANRAFAEITGVGGPPYRLFTPSGEPYPEDRLPFVRALQARAVVVVDDVAIVRPDGRRIDLRVHAKPIFDGAGEVTHVAMAFVDITREVQAERDAAAAREQVHEVVAGAPLTLTAFDAKGIVTLTAGRAHASLAARRSRSRRRGAARRGVDRNGGRAAGQRARRRRRASHRPGRRALAG